MQPMILWPVVMYDFQWPEHDTYVDALREVCYQQEAKKNISGVAPNAKGGLYESGFDFCKINNPAVLAFTNWAKYCFFQAAQQINAQYWPKAGNSVQIEIHESWCHITRDGGYHDAHTHPNSSWSAIYYLDTGDMEAGTTNGVNRFYNPNHNMYIDMGTAYHTANSSIDMHAEPGMMVVFPSWIQHSAIPYRGEKDRIVIALNCQITRPDLSQAVLKI